MSNFCIIPRFNMWSISFLSGLTIALGIFLGGCTTDGMLGSMSNLIQGANTIEQVWIKFHYMSLTVRPELKIHINRRKFWQISTMWIAWIKPLMTSMVICLHTHLSSQRILTRLNALQNLRPRITLVSMISVMKKLHFLITLAWVQVTLILPMIFTDCLLYPITLTSPQGFNS